MAHGAGAKSVLASVWMQDLAICAYCDTVHRRVRVRPRVTARCITCNARLSHGDADLGAMLAVTITAAVAFVITNAFPLVTLSSQGTQTQATLWRAIVASYDSELPVVALVLAVTLMVAPLLEITMFLWLLVPLVARTRPPGFAHLMRLLHLLRPWRLVEVFLLGVVVAIVKLDKLATVHAGYGVYGIAVMSLALASLATIDRAILWRRADQVTA